jgi:hypothetical protein
MAHRLSRFGGVRIGDNRWMSFRTQPLSCCPECGQWLTASALRDGSHECDPAARIEYHVMRARFELSRIESELASYLATPRARNLLAFRRYLEERERKAA